MTAETKNKEWNMGTIPDFALQVREVEQNLASEWQYVQSGWQDRVADSFCHGVMEPYMRNFQQYVTGEGINGYGIAQLVQQMERHLMDMDALID